MQRTLTTLAFSVPLLAAANDPIASQQMTITAEVVEDVALNVTPMIFPAFTTADADGGQRDAESVITVNAPEGLNYRIRIDRGEHAPSGAQRFMQLDGGDALMSYRLYSNASRTTQWGTGSDSGPESYIHADVAAAGTGSDQSFSVYGRAMPGQSGSGGTFTAIVGDYTDTVTVSIVTTD